MPIESSGQLEADMVRRVGNSVFGLALSRVKAIELRGALGLAPDHAIAIGNAALYSTNSYRGITADAELEGEDVVQARTQF